MLMPARIPTIATAVSSSTKLIDASPQSLKAEITLTLQVTSTDAQQHLTGELKLAFNLNVSVASMEPACCHRACNSDKARRVAPGYCNQPPAAPPA